MDDQLGRQSEHRLGSLDHQVHALLAAQSAHDAHQGCALDRLHAQLAEHGLPVPLRLLDAVEVLLELCGELRVDDVLEEGEEGELVITTLTKEAFPVIRYRTHDLTSIDTSPCACGRTSARMRKVRARTDDMLIIRGVNVFPSQIEDALMQIEGVEPHYLIVVNRDGPMDDLEVRIEVAEAIFSDTMADLVGFTRKVAEKIYSVVGLHAKVTLVEPGTIERTAGKAKRVIDNRQVE